jgi:hypothetical protein
VGTEKRAHRAKTTEEASNMTLENAARKILHGLPPKIGLYVRKGEHQNERTISVNPIPEKVDPLRLVEKGFAVDGNSATLSVDSHTYAEIREDGDLSSKRGCQARNSGTGRAPGL